MPTKRPPTTKAARLRSRAVPLTAKGKRGSKAPRGRVGSTSTAKSPYSP